MRVLLLSYLFPPNSAVGARRWEQLSVLASERGWQTHVVTLDPVDVPNPDLHRLNALPEAVHVHGVRTSESGMDRFTRFAWSHVRRLRGNPIPERTVDWRSGAAIAPSIMPSDRQPSVFSDAIRRAKRAYSAVKQIEVYRPWSQMASRQALSLSREYNFDVVVSSGPPHMVHRAGREVARRLQLPHVVDMRDLWSLAERLPDDFNSPVWYWLSRYYERAVIRDAALVVANTAAATAAMQKCFPASAGRMVTVMNGADEALRPPPMCGDKFVIAFAGTIYLDRDPRVFFRAVSHFVRDEQIGPNELRLLFIGNVAQYRGVTLQSVAADEGVADYLDIEAFVPHADVTRRLANAHMLLSLPQDSTMAIPAKIFEYSAFSAWLLILAARQSATEIALRGSSAFVVEPHDVSGMRAAIVKAYSAFKQGRHATPVAADGRFGRRAQADVLFSAISELAAGNKK